MWLFGDMAEPSVSSLLLRVFANRMAVTGIALFVLSVELEELDALNPKWWLLPPLVCLLNICVTLLSLKRKKEPIFKKRNSFVSCQPKKIYSPSIKIVFASKMLGTNWEEDAVTAPFQEQNLFNVCLLSVPKLFRLGGTKLHAHDEDDVVDGTKRTMLLLLLLL